MNTSPTQLQSDESGRANPVRSRFAPWPPWAAAAGALGMVSTVVTDTRVDADEDFDFPVAAEHMATLDYDLFRVGGFTGYLTVACLVVFMACGGTGSSSGSAGPSARAWLLAGSVSAAASRRPTAGRERWATTATAAPRRARTTTRGSTPTT